MIDEYYLYLEDKKPEHSLNEHQKNSLYESFYSTAVETIVGKRKMKMITTIRNNYDHRQPKQDNGWPIHIILF